MQIQVLVHNVNKATLKVGLAVPFTIAVALIYFVLLAQLTHVSPVHKENIYQTEHAIKVEVYCVYKLVAFIIQTA